MSRIFKRQIKRHFGKDFDLSSLDPKIYTFLQNVEESYEEFEKEKRLLENTIDINSQELFEANKEIQRKNENLNALLDENSVLLQNRIEENIEIGTQLKQHKQAMDSALLLTTFDLNEKITFVNENFCELSGYKPHELLGKSYDFFYTNSDREEKSAEILETIKTNKIWRGILKQSSKNDNSHVLNATIFPITNSKKEIVEYMGIFQDVTAIEESRIKALELDKSKSLFLANMSHELRTPLNAIIGFSQLVQRLNDIPPKAKSYIEKINTSGEHLLKLINSILDFSKIEAGQIKLEKIKIDLKATLISIINQLENEAKKKGIGLDLHYNDTMPNNFLGDSLRLTQIMTNLISNAIKFTHDGEVTVLVSQPSKNRVRIEVKDTGIGLDDKDKKKLFQQFSQADDSTTRQYGGTGLGLSISKELVKLMNGKIWVESILKKGSSFIFEIDLEEVIE